MHFDIQYIYGICAGALACYLCCFAAMRPAGLLQQSGYEGKRFLSWYFGKGNIQRKRLSLLALSLALSTALFDLCFSFLPPAWANLTSVAPFLALSALYLLSESKFALKVRAKMTPRFTRLIIAHSVLLFLIAVSAGFGLAFASVEAEARWFFVFRFVPLCALPLLLPFTLICANALMKLFETPHNRRFIRKAGRALAESKCVKVGVTGSFGKTSVKTYAAALLSRRYRVIATPESYNTPMGIARTVKERGTDCDVFLAEMGARHTGDIAELCELVKPTVGVVVGICAQHVETFGSLDAIRSEKGELAKRTEVCVLGRSAADMQAKRAVAEGRDFRTENVLCSTEGTSFDFVCGDKRAAIKTPLLGRHAAEDVSLAIALCLQLGMELEELAEAAKNLRPVPHRLQKIEEGRIVILDDAYNSNIEGAKNAIETLGLFPGRKVVVTPGLVELGQLEAETNGALGAALASSEAEVILVGETLVQTVQNGFLAAGGSEERLRIVPTLSDAGEILADELLVGDCVLFLNDLPDLYL